VVEDRRRKHPTFALRFRAYGKREYLTLGTADGEWTGYDGKTGWTRKRAEEALRHVLSDVERGKWKPARPEPAASSGAGADGHRPDLPRVRVAVVRGA
jgi:hypothetical protein